MRVFSIISGLIIVVVFTMKSTRLHRKKLSKSPIVWKDTVGTLDPRGYRKGKIYYIVNGITYHTDFTGITDKKLTDVKYVMRYNIVNPEEAQVDNWHPVFVKGEKTHLLLAKIIKIQHLKKLYRPVPAIIYTYKIPYSDRKVEIERWIYLPKDYQQRYPNLKEGQYYEVEVWDKNIYRSVLHLDKAGDTLQLLTK